MMFTFDGLVQISRVETNAQLPTWLALVDNAVDPVCRLTFVNLHDDALLHHVNAMGTRRGKLTTGVTAGSTVM